MGPAKSAPEALATTAFVNTEHVAEQAQFIRKSMPAHGLFAGQEWRISPRPFPIGPELAKEFQTLGRVLLQFYRAVNLIYRQSLAGKQPAWVAEWLDRGKPAELLAWQRSSAFKNDLPRVIRPDVILTESGFSVSELDSVPGGIGLTAWLNKTYSEAMGLGHDGQTARGDARPTVQGQPAILGGADGMLQGFSRIFGEAKHVHIVVSGEAATYRPEMEWVAEQLGARFQIRDTRFKDFAAGDAVYRFFELFDLGNVVNAREIFTLAEQKSIQVTPPPKPIFEEKMLFALLWNRNLQPFWRQQLGEGFYARLLKVVPYTWLVDPTPLPPQGAIPELNLTDWSQLKALSQRGRELILKISGFSDKAWGSRGVYLGSDLSHADWSAAVDEAVATFPTSPHVLQRYEHPRLVETSYFDFERQQLVRMPGRVRLCPYYFVAGEGDGARAELGGVLATICPSDKKIIHGMKDAVLAPCSI